MDNLPLGLSREIPVVQLLEKAGSAVARMALLDEFSAGDAELLTEGRFRDDNVSVPVEILFIVDPVTGNYRSRPKLDRLVLGSLNELYPTAASELATRLVSRFIGPEGLSAGQLLDWMLRNRWHHLQRAAISALAAFSPYELAEVCQNIASRPRAAVERGLLAPYGTTAERWQRALRRGKSTTAAQYLRFDPLDALASLSQFSDSPDIGKVGKESRGFRREVGSYRDGYLPQAFELLSRKSSGRLAHQIHSRPSGFPWASDTPETSGTVTSLDNDVDPIIKLIGDSTAVAESTRQLLSLVLQDRGPGMITETINISVGAGDCHRRASISVTESARVNGMLYSYLGALPGSVGSNLPLTVREVNGEKLIVGGGAVVSRYREEVSIALSRLQVSHEASPISASDWGRLERSLREPWRFISSSRDYIDLEVADAEWMEPLRATIDSREVWPFRGASPRTILLEGFRSGEDDHYSAAARVVDGYRIRALELRSVPRSVGAPAIERPSRIRLYADWRPGNYGLLVAIVLVAATALASVASFANYISFSEYDVVYVASLTASFSAPLIAVLASSAFRPSNNSSNIKTLLSRLGGVVVLTLVLIALTLLSDFSSVVRFVMVVTDVVVALGLVLSLGLSLWTRAGAIMQVLRQYRGALEASGRQEVR
jgi:hypothetical protein